MRVPPADSPALAGLPDMQLFKLAAHAGSVFEPWHRYLSALHLDLELDPRLRELTILQVAHDEGCDYQRVQHEAIARRVGVPDEEIEAIRAGETPLEVVRGITRDGEASEESLAALVDEIGVRQAVELVLVAGQYVSLARLMKTFALNPEAPVAA